MIKSLFIRNFGIIDNAEIEFGDGFNVLTGETGAGKSMIVNAMNLVFGKRNSAVANLWPDRKTIVEMTASVSGEKLKPLLSDNDIDYANPVIIRREINSAGRSRAFVNDTPVALSVLRDLAAIIVDISEQHQTLSIYHKNKRLALVDDYAGNYSLLAVYQAAFADEQQTGSRLRSLKQKLKKLEEEQDYYRFQLEELEKLGYNAGDEKMLEEEQEVLSNAEEIKSSLYAAFQTIATEEYGAVAAVEETVRKLRPAADHHSKASVILERLAEISFSLSEISTELENEFENIEYSRERLDEVENRLSEIYRLVQKHKLSAGDELLGVLNEYKNKLTSFDSLGDEIKETEKQYRSVMAKLSEAATSLTDSRKAVIDEMAAGATALLHSMAIPSAKVEFRLDEISGYQEFGKDEVEILFTANKGIDPQPVEEVASGGELSRLMLALKSLIGKKMQMPTLIFDEIDTGISGETAVRVGEMMKDLSQNTQLIVVSHLPQIAAGADVHFEIFKNETGDKTISGVRKLSPEERVETLATMLSGKKDSDKARLTAKEMLGTE